MKTSKIISLCIISLFFFACGQGTNKTGSAHIAVFIPGIVSGSPVYEMLSAGVTDAVNDFNDSNKLADDKKVRISIIEAGTNQAEWSSKIAAITSTGMYSVIVSSNPSLPGLVAPLTKQFPEQKFILLDAFIEGNKNIASMRYNQREQAYMTGYAAGLATTAPSASMKYANAQKKIALIAAQEYPVMQNIILPSFIEGAHAADPEISVDFRIVGNWYDAAKGSELARALYKNGVDVILPIAGGASQGVISAAEELGFYITWFDDNGFSKAPGYVISSSVMKQHDAAYQMTDQFLKNKLEFGTARTVGIRDGFIDFIQDNPQYTASVPEDIRDKISKRFSDIKNGVLSLPSPK